MNFFSQKLRPKNKNGLKSMCKFFVITMSCSSNTVIKTLPHKTGAFFKVKRSKDFPTKRRFLFTSTKAASFRIFPRPETLPETARSRYERRITESQRGAERLSGPATPRCSALRCAPQSSVPTACIFYRRPSLAPDYCGG